MHDTLEPIVEKIETVGDLYFRSVFLPLAGMVIPQHAHDYDHVTFVAHGRACGWAGTVYLGERSAGEGFEVKAGQLHRFQSVVNQTRLTCVHSMVSAMRILEKGL